MRPSPESFPIDVPPAADPPGAPAPRASGTLVVVVGASGSGKDSLLAAAREAFADEPAVHFVVRTVTRPAGDAHEPHASATEEAFEALSAHGAFAVEWGAHGLRYGVPRSALEAIRDGRLVVLNGSREALSLIAAAFACRREIVHVAVSRDRLEMRLRARTRERGVDRAAPGETDRPRLRRRPGLAARQQRHARRRLAPVRAPPRIARAGARRDDAPRVTGRSAIAGLRATGSIGLESLRRRRQVRRRIDPRAPRPPRTVVRPGPTGLGLRTTRPTADTGSPHA